jgi:prepilin-type N-terminal cleavage/methylation domain-containing protein
MSPRPRPEMGSPRHPRFGEAGFSLVELMVTSAILLLIAAAAMTMLVAGQRTTSFATRRGQTQDEVRLAVERLTKDLRQVTRFNTTFTASGSGSWTGHDLDFVTYTPASPDLPVRVRWWVSGTTLNRQEWRSDGTSAGTSVLLQAVTPPGGAVPDLFYCNVLQGSEVVTGSPVPWQITVTVTVDLVDPGATYSIQTQVQLRNLQSPQPA